MIDNAASSIDCLNDSKVCCEQITERYFVNIVTYFFNETNVDRIEEVIGYDKMQRSIMALLGVHLRKCLATDCLPHTVEIPLSLFYRQHCADDKVSVRICNSDMDNCRVVI